MGKQLKFYFPANKATDTKLASAKHKMLILVNRISIMSKYIRI